MTPTTPQPPNLLFRAVVIAGAIFSITVMSMVAATFGNSEAPPNKFFTAYGLPLILAETAILLILIFLAMAVDQRRTAQEQYAKARRTLEENLKEPPQPSP